MDLTSWEFFEESAEAAFDKGSLDQAWELFHRAADKAIASKASVGAVWSLYGSMKTVAFEKVDENLVERTFREWLEYAEKTRGVSREMKIGVLVDYSRFLREVEDFDTGVKVCRQAYAEARKAYSAKHLNVASLGNNLAVMLKKKGEFEEAGKLMEEGLQVFLEKEGEQSPSVAIQCHNLGELHFALEDYEKAKEYHRKALIINEDGEEDLFESVLDNLNSLAKDCRELGEYTDALILYERALKIAEEKLGLESLHWAVLADNCAQVFQERGDLQRSYELLEKVYPVYLSEYTDLDPTTMDVRDRLERLKDKLEESL